LIDDHTRRGLDDAIVVEAHGELSLKGRARPVEVYSVHVDAVVTESVWTSARAAGEEPAPRQGS